MSIIYFKCLYPDAQILSFEPNDRAFCCLEKNIKQNSLNCITAYKKAISAKDGILDFFYDENNPGSLEMSIVHKRLPKEKTTVTSRRLSHYINRPVDLIKLDVEGAEFDIIQELIDSNKIHLIKEMIIEYHHHINNKCDTFSKMLKLLEMKGFGYQIKGNLESPVKFFAFQDIMIYAYNKSMV